MHRVLFFQAEDGIRDLTVTGVQTCALPISIFNRSTLQNLLMLAAELGSQWMTLPSVAPRWSNSSTLLAQQCCKQWLTHSNLHYRVRSQRSRPCISPSRWRAVSRIEGRLR